MVALAMYKNLSNNLELIHYLPLMHCYGVQKSFDPNSFTSLATFFEP